MPFPKLRAEVCALFAELVEAQEEAVAHALWRRRISRAEYQREWRRANAARLNQRRREQLQDPSKRAKTREGQRQWAQKQRRESATYRERQKAAYERWYQAQKRNPAKWRRLLERVKDGKKARHA